MKILDTKIVNAISLPNPNFRNIGNMLYFWSGNLHLHQNEDFNPYSGE